MKAMLMSIKPKWCELIANGEKTIEVRKTKPKIDTPFKCYIYCTKYKTVKDRFWIGKPLNKYCGGRYVGNRSVIGEFICDSVGEYACNSDAHYLLSILGSALSVDDIIQYCNGNTLYGYHISNLKIYDKPKELSEFKAHNRKCCYSDLGLAIPECKDCNECNLTRPPQSWCYVEELEK